MRATPVLLDMPRAARVASRVFCLTVCVAVSWTLVLAQPAAQSAAPGQRLQEAVRQMETVGDYEAALRILKELTSSADRSVAARAWLYTGIARERLGQTAADAYERVVRDFGDQAEPVQRARARLAALQPPLPAAAPTPGTRQLKWPMFSPYGPPSRDGRLITGGGINPFNSLVLWQVATGQPRVFTPPDADASDIAHFSSLSPDGTSVLVEFYRPDQAEGSVLLRLLHVPTNSWKTLFSFSDVEVAQPTRWMPDGRRVLVSMMYRDSTAELALVGIDGTKRTLLKPDVWPRQVDLSPDGRFVVYDQPQRAGSDDRDVWLLDIASGTTRAIASHGGNDADPVFTPDGLGVVFSSNRTGGVWMWLQRLVDGKPDGEPARLGPNVGPYVPLGFTSTGTLFYRTVAGLVDVFLADVDLSQGRVGEPTKVEGGRFIGSNVYSSWSPDSRRLVFVSRREELGWARTHTLVVHDLSTGDATELRPSLDRIAWSAWSPDATTLLLRGTGRVGEDPRPRQTLWLVDMSTAAARAVMPPGEPDTVFSPRWRRDGKAVYFVRDRRVMERVIDSGEERVLIENAGMDLDVSPDGRQAAFVQRTPNGPTLFVCPLDGGARGPVAEYPANYFVTTAGWTPDGSEIVFTARDTTAVQGRTGEGLVAAPWLTEVWAARADGSARRRLGVITAVNPRTFRLSPDGRRLSFEAGMFSWANWAMDGFLPPAPRNAKARASNAKRQLP